MPDVTIIAPLYGDSHDGFVDRWLGAIEALDPAPADIIIGVDRLRGISHRCGEALHPPTWKYPQAELLDAAFRWVRTEWVWIVDVDDIVLPDALDGLPDDVDVWLAGYRRTDELEHAPLPLENDVYLKMLVNSYPQGSFIRRSALELVDGWRDVAFQDWDLWRRLAAAGVRFGGSGRVQYLYEQGPHTRTTRELGQRNRADYIAELGLGKSLV